MNDYKRVLLVVLAAILLMPTAFWFQSLINTGGEKNARMFNTAIQADQKDRFNYTIDSHQGKLLGHGKFEPTGLVKFPEMSKRFAYVEKVREEYTQHQSCTTDSKGNQSCTTYYTWDYAGSEELSTPGYKLHDRKYLAHLFDVGEFKQGTDACEFTPHNTASWWRGKNGCSGGRWYTDSDTRYYYNVINPKGFTAGLIADVSEGQLAPVKGDTIKLENKTPEQMLKDANDYKTPGTVFMVIWLILIVVAMAVGAYYWAFNDGVLG